ncbi:hypothetical protein DERP_008899 [Dermatophagoides pteronyssinus]|uniref:Uncharacterized protein n=1 Tax=Dermatophagoides pteronyssinus TaxID=6956 RepID=A0ABQ8JN54_DERPT|nr:hypothetical protein DERP_008899 [Dermatophagoides pteronyssinus]
MIIIIFMKRKWPFYGIELYQSYQQQPYWKKNIVSIRLSIMYVDDDEKKCPRKMSIYKKLYWNKNFVAFYQ